MGDNQKTTEPLKGDIRDRGDAEIQPTVTKLEKHAMPTGHLKPAPPPSNSGTQPINSGGSEGTSSDSEGASSGDSKSPKSE